MRLQNKMITIVGVIVLVTILVWVFVAQALFMGNYAQLEKNDVQDALDATRYSLERSVAEINETARDYAAWDDTYSFVVDNNTNYITDNLVGTTFENLRLNILFIENTDGKIVFAQAYDLANRSFVALPSDLDRLTSISSPLFFHNESAQTSTGMLYTANGPLLVASQPIVTSVGTGPIHGTLMFGRYLTPDVMEAIAGPNKDVSAYPFGAQSPEDVQRVQPALAEGTTSVIVPVNTTNVAGFTLLPDIYGNPSLIVKEVLPRTLYQAGLASTNTFLVLLVILGAISLTCMVWSLRQSVVAPLLRINASLARIRTSDDLSKRIPERGDFELVWLARAINATLASLESSHVERKAAGVELRQSEEMLRLILNASEDAIFLTDTNGVFLTANDALAHRLGVAAAEIIGTKGFTEKPEDVAKQRRAHFARAIATKQPVRFDDEHAGRRLENVYQPLVDAHGNVTKVAVFSHDATERKRAEADLIQSEQRIRELTDALPVVVYEADETGRVTFANATSFDMFGYTKKELEEGMSIFQLVTDADKERARTVFRRRKSVEGVGRMEYTGLRKDGSTFPISVLGAPIERDGAVVGVRGIAVDITERMRDEQKLRESDRRIRELTDALPVVVYEADKTSRVTFVNATIFDMFGYTKEEFAEKSILQVTAEADRERARSMFYRRMDGEDVGREYTGRRKDGSTFPILVHGAPIKRDGAVVGVRGIIIDITERKQGEERLKEHTHTIETLNRIMTEGNRTTDVQSFAKTVTDLTLELLRVDVGTIHLNDYDARCAKLRYATGIPDITVGAIKDISIDDELYARVLVEGKPLFVEGHEALRVPHSAELGLVSFAIVPMYHYDKRIGTLTLGSFKRHTFSQAEQELLSAIGSEAGVVIAKLQADEAIRGALEERETLLKEIHHRVKNNMQVVSSLLSLQAAHATEPETIEMLSESQRRIRSMALIHEKLYRSGSLAEIDFGDYVESLINDLRRMYNVAERAITITVDIENVQLGVDTAIPCALIVNELVSNSFKYAFPSGRVGDVTVALQRANGAYTLSVVDNGVGFPADVDFRATDSLGMQLVVMLINQLDGTITLDRTKGTTFIITFKPAGAR